MLPVWLSESILKRGFAACQGSKLHFGESPTIEGDRVRRKTYLATSSVINGYGTMK